MDWKQVLSFSHKSLTDIQKDEIYEFLVASKKDSVDKKNFKKVFEVFQHILKYKGDMVNVLLTELEELSTSTKIDTPALLDELTQLKTTVEKLETEKSRFKTRIKELNEENASLQRRSNDVSNFGSEREDSPDALSEIDKQEELLNNISTKNKHIKRLLRDIESLESQCTTKSTQVDELRVNLMDATKNLTLVTNQVDEYRFKLKELDSTIDSLNKRNIELEQHMTDMRNENGEREFELQEFGKQLENRALVWKRMLEEKNERLDSLRIKYDEILNVNPGYDIDADRVEMRRLTEAIKDRDQIISDLETQLNELSQELVDSTEIMNKLARERENTQETVTQTQRKSCCDDIKLMLENSTRRCQELQEIVTNLEETNIHKSKQAMDAIEALQSYQNGEDGLSQAIKKNAELHSKVQSRDKQIRALVMELNSLQDEAQENIVLRKRLGIPEDEFVSTKSLSIRQKKFEKINERLMLKLRASEEMRLQLKLDKNDLKRAISQLRNKNELGNDQDAVSVDVSMSKGETEVKYCEKCLGKYSVDEGTHKCVSCLAKRNCNFCGNCQKQMKIGAEGNAADFKSQISDWESKYTEVVDENENLLLGMHNILEKLRNYDAESDHVVIDTTILEKLLHALDARSVSGWYHPAMRIQNELIASKEREYALKERCRISETILGKSDRPIPKERLSLKSQPQTVQPTNVDGSSITNEYEKDINERAKQFDSLYQHIVDQEAEIEKLRLQLAETLTEKRENETKIEELKVYECQFNELTEAVKRSEETKDALLAEQMEQVVQLKNAINGEAKKTKFSQEDYDGLNKIHKHTKEKLNRLMFELRKELIESRKMYSEHQTKQKRTEPIVTPDKNEITALRSELNNLKNKTSYLNSVIVKNMKALDDENETALNFERIEKLGVVRNNFVVDFITKTEYEELERRCDALTTQIDELTVHSSHLEKLLNLSQEQIKSQQQILTKTSEEEINLRHLVVDIQATSNEKYIIAKLSRELQLSQEMHELAERESKSVSEETVRLQHEVEAMKNELVEQEEIFRKKNVENDFKLKFLSKTFKELRQSYHEFMPMYPVNDFLADFIQILECKKKLRTKIDENEKMDHQNQLDEVLRLAGDSLGSDAIENKITVIKFQTHAAHLEQQNKSLQQQIQILSSELEQQIQKEVTSTEHWNIIKLLFEDNRNENCVMLEKGTQATAGTNDQSTNTDQLNESDNQIPTQSPATQLTSAIQTTAVPTMAENLSLINENTQKSMESQLKQAMSLASTRSSLLLETENRLAITQGRIKLLERNLEEKERQLKDEREKSNRNQSPRRDDNILSVTITSLQNLLLEKDTTLSRYQDLLRTERQDRSKSFDDHRNEVKLLQNTVDELEVKIRMKDREIEKLMGKMKDLQEKQVGPVNLSVVPAADVSAFEEEFSQMSDKHIEDMFLNERQVTFGNTEPDLESAESRGKIQNLEKDLEKLQGKLRDVRNRENFLEKTLMERDKEIAALNERINDQEMEYKDISENILNRREIDQLKEMLDEKDRHIGDLTDTLTHFHDDQQKFINDTSLHSAEQVSQLSADLNRCEATNRILNTQLEAMKRQIVNISQREGQAREMVKSLKTQLMKRPVISVKSERSYSNREDILQKRLNQMENELLLTKEDLRKQTSLAQNRRTKDAAELGLWDKQKRFQQLSENLKTKLAERENELEKLKSTFGTAKATIARLEREKNLLENRLRAGKKQLCLAPSCPNLHLNKYTPAESPESCQTSDYGDGSSVRDKRLDISDNNQELIDALKSRIEMQQRKIVAMELEGKGSNAVTSEIEKLHEKLSSCESQNIRLEARNLQLQLDYDLVKQEDNSERTKRQIKHLEDYILALKGELAQSASTSHKATTNSISNSSTSQMEQTILSMRRLVERLKVENKNLKEGKGLNATKGIAPKVQDNSSKLRQELDKVQQSYSEALDKVSTLQIELDMHTGLCKNCKTRNSTSSEPVDSAIETLKEKLIKKTQLLEKAKILLARAAAKEKNFREQIIFWKRRCSELQNVPVIDEASE